MIVKALCIFGVYFVLMAHLDRCGFWHGLVLVLIAMMFGAAIYDVPKK